MRVLTINPIQAFQMVYSNQIEPLILNRRSLFRGDLLLACSKIKPVHVEEYIEVYQPPSRLNAKPMPHPVEWARSWEVANAIFARARLVRVEAIPNSRTFRYTFSEFQLIEPIRIDEVRPFWWFFDLNTGQKIDLFPLSDENIRYFYQVCDDIDNFREYDADFFMLSADPRVLPLRRGILRKLRNPHGARRWTAIRAPRNWRALFAERFGKQYVSYNQRGRNYVNASSSSQVRSKPHGS